MTNGTPKTFRRNGKAGQGKGYNSSGSEDGEKTYNEPERHK
jgi:hypothetical protein